MASDILVIVGPAGEAGRKVRSIVQRLRVLGVLTNESSLLWLDGSNDRWIMSDLTGWQMTRNVQDEIALLRCESAMFITVELSRPALRAFDAAFEPSVAVAATEEIKFPPGMAASRFRLVAPATYEDRFDPAALPGWNTVVATPENRFSDRHPPASLKVDVDGDPGDYFGHVAAHIATVAGLWRNDAQDLFGADFAPIAEGSAITQRVFSRAVVGIDVSAETVEPFLDQQIVSWPRPKSADGSFGAVAHPIPHELVAAAVEQLGAVEGFRYHRPAGYVPPEANRISITDAFRSFFQRVRQATFDMPSVYSSHAKQQLEAAANRLTTAITGLGGPDSSLTFTASSVAAGDFGSAGEMLDRIGSPVFVQATPAAWRTLRSMCFGLIDGDRSSDADDIATVEGRRTVITDPSLIAPDPDSSFVPLNKEDGGAISPSDVRNFTKALEAKDATAPSYEALRSWKAKGHRTQSLLWQLGERIVAEEERATSDVAKALTVLAERSETAYSEYAQQRLDRLLTRAHVAWAVLLLGLGYAVYGTVTDLLDGSFFIAGSLGDMTPATWVTLAVIACFVLAVLWYIREEFRIRHQLDEHYRRIEWARATLPKALTELHRLTVTYDQFIDWAKVISHVVHRPWGSAKEEQLLEVRAGFEEAELPHSLTVVYGTGNSSGESHLRVGLEGELVRVGWLGQIYNEVSGDALEEFANGYGRATGDRLDPDEDVPTAPNGTRAWLAEQFALGQGRELTRVRARRLATSYLLNLDPNETLPRIDPGWHPETLFDGLSTSVLLSELADADQIPLDQSIFTPTGQQRGARDVLVRSSFVPASIRPDGRVAEPRNELSDFTLVSTRVELSGPTPMQHFTLFGPPAQGERAPGVQPTASSEIGPPPLLIEEPLL